jgi:hypothetical protein
MEALDRMVALDRTVDLDLTVSQKLNQANIFACTRQNLVFIRDDFCQFFYIFF